MRCAILLLATACAHEAAPAPAAAAPVIGAYRCTITDHGYRYPPFPCAIREVGHQLVLAKLGGSVRFEGALQARADGFTFTGQLFCPTGDCTEQVAGTFVHTPGGALRGTLGSGGLVVEMFRVDESGYGGAAYGGARYGGAAYGGSNEIE